MDGVSAQLAGASTPSLIVLRPLPETYNRHFETLSTFHITNVKTSNCQSCHTTINKIIGSTDGVYFGGGGKFETDIIFVDDVGLGPPFPPLCVRIFVPKTENSPFVVSPILESGSDLADDDSGGGAGVLVCVTLSGVHPRSARPPPGLPPHRPQRTCVSPTAIASLDVSICLLMDYRPRKTADHATRARRPIVPGKTTVDNRVRSAHKSLDDSPFSAIQSYCKNIIAPGRGHMCPRKHKYLGEAKNCTKRRGRRAEHIAGGPVELRYPKRGGRGSGDICKQRRRPRPTLFIFLSASSRACRLACNRTRAPS
jgi:hypothetical protein